MNTAVAAAHRADARTEAARLLERALAGLAGQDVLGVISLPAPNAPVEALLDSGAGDAVLWAPREGAAFSGIGAATTLVASGPDRFREIRERSPAHQHVQLGVPGSPLPLWFGGFAFQAGTARAPWDAFGDARFVLPRWRYARAGGYAWLDLAVHGREAGARGHWLGELDRLWRVLSGPPPSDQRRPARLVAAGPGQRDEYEAAVGAIVDNIRAGRFDKVVAARRALLHLDPAPEPRRLLSRLGEQAPGCTRFAFRVGAGTFLGATPERLIDKHGSGIETEALAGSIRAGSAAQASLLRRSRKDLGEHRFVVRQIVGCLSRLCSSLGYPDEPEVRALQHVLHLCTPIRGELSSTRHVLELVEALHPTPAVGGVPTEAAQRWIARHEREARGWYAGPVGCFDAAGDGQFAVALRSGLFEGPRAYLYAGAGVVRDSDPASEYAETRLKLEALLSVLGVDS